VVPFDHDAFFAAVPGDVAVDEQVAAEVVAANTDAAPAEGVLVVDPVVADRGAGQPDAATVEQAADRSEIAIANVKVSCFMGRGPFSLR
jgi:hypothetical protein